MIDFSKIVKSFSDVNKRYKNPTIKPSKSVKFALLMLRIYLLFLVVLLVIKFISIIKVH